MKGLLWVCFYGALYAAGGWMGVWTAAFSYEIVSLLWATLKDEELRAAESRRRLAWYERAFDVGKHYGEMKGIAAGYNRAKLHMQQFLENRGFP